MSGAFFLAGRRRKWPKTAFCAAKADFAEQNQPNGVKIRASPHI
jgi:hypothetical protein